MRRRTGAWCAHVAAASRSTQARFYPMRWLLLPAGRAWGPHPLGLAHSARGCGGDRGRRRWQLYWCSRPLAAASASASARATGFHSHNDPQGTRQARSTRRPPRRPRSRRRVYTLAARGTPGRPPRPPWLVSSGPDPGPARPRRLMMVSSGPDCGWSPLIHSATHSQCTKRIALALELHRLPMPLP
jgi:hypothetical protein